MHNIFDIHLKNFITYKSYIYYINNKYKSILRQNKNSRTSLKIIYLKEL
jgi:hypothetical protein